MYGILPRRPQRGGGVEVRPAPPARRPTRTAFPTRSLPLTSAWSHRRAHGSRARRPRGRQRHAVRHGLSPEEETNCRASAGLDRPARTDLRLPRVEPRGSLMSSTLVRSDPSQLDRRARQTAEATPAQAAFHAVRNEPVPPSAGDRQNHDRLRLASLWHRAARAGDRIRVTSRRCAQAPPRRPASRRSRPPSAAPGRGTGRWPGR